MNTKEIANPFETIVNELQSLKNEVIENRKMISLLSRSKGSKGGGDDYKTIQEIAEMYGVQKQTIRQSLIPYSTEIEVLRNGTKGKQLVNFTHYRKVFGNQVSA